MKRKKFDKLLKGLLGVNPINKKNMSSNCENHKNEVAGISDMKILAEMIGDLHYQSLQHLFFELSIKLNEDGIKDSENGRLELGASLDHCSDHLANAAHCMVRAWKISKPYMTSSEANDEECDTTGMPNEQSAG